MLTYAMAMSDSSWNSVNNVIFSKPASVQPSGFYPSAQYTTIKSETTKSAGATGQTFRLTTPENQSMAETYFQSLLGWVGSPYEADKAIPVKVAESKQLASSVETKDPIGEGLDWALSQSKKIVTLYDQIKGVFSKRETIIETPRAGYPEGTDVANTNNTTNRTADVIAAGKQLYEQVKGLFGLGYPQTTPQPAATVTTEIAGLAGLSMGTILIIILLVYFLVKK